MTGVMCEPPMQDEREAPQQILILVNTGKNSDNDRSRIQAEILTQFWLRSTCKCKDGELATGMVRKELRHVENFPVHHHPAVILGCVLGHLVQSVARSVITTATASRDLNLTTECEYCDVWVWGWAILQIRNIICSECRAKYRTIQIQKTTTR